MSRGEFYIYLIGILFFHVGRLFREMKNFFEGVGCEETLVFRNS